MRTDTRTEKDGFGPIDVPANKYWGAQTQRSLKYFSIGDNRLPVELIHAMALLKKGVAAANAELGLLDADRCRLIRQAADEVISGKLDEHFPLHVWMTGSGTQSNMNVNEVISNRAIEISGGTMGSKEPIHPNDHVNMSQSTNDAFPSAMCIATAMIVKNRLIPSLRYMHNELEEKSKAWAGIVKIGRTHMQDAVPMTLGQEFSGYAAMLTDNIKRLEWLLEDVYKLALGGTAVGTGINTKAGFAELAAKEIGNLSGLPFVTAPNKFAVQGAHDALVMLSAGLKTLAGSLLKISNDIKFLSCGPRAGIRELQLPSNEPGSSIMPGKVNPTQCEAMAMVCVQVMGYDAAVAIAGCGGELEMNVYKPLIIYNIIQSVKILSDGCRNFTDYLIKGTRPDRENIDRYLRNSLMLVTALAPVIGYDKAAQMAHYADEHNCSLKEANHVLNFVSEKEFDTIVDPSKMVRR